ncbi:Glutamyl-tRNA(Gln) amidotransferase and Asn Gln amidotransferase domain containing protein [Aphelenchoides bicaudatus]|nr:Glutamyl-tRNA(Gln) amidotransferase and Asn Gln amidotransferase domain containing protein [Aphelenchoides bicaudatus]
MNDLKRPNKIVRYKPVDPQAASNAPPEDSMPEYMNILGMIFSMLGLMMRVSCALSNIPPIILVDEMVFVVGPHLLLCFVCKHSLHRRHKANSELVHVVDLCGCYVLSSKSNSNCTAVGELVVIEMSTFFYYVLSCSNMRLLTTRRLLYQCHRLNSVRKAEAVDLNLKPVIGLEIHAQLLTQSKMFSDAPVENQAPSNTNVSLFDLGIPGTLPTLNRKCVELALRTAVLLNCKIAKECRFDRKHYFYPDMPTGYQITQHELPIARNGYLDYFVRPENEDRGFQEEDRRRIHIKQIQMEMDSGKIVYGADRNLVDLNRAGVGLVEIVTSPDLNSSLEASCFVEQLRLLLLHNQICQGDMHLGQMRFDANVSISVDGSEGVRTETKNISSFRELQQCLNFEVKRQTDLIKRGEEVRPETRAASNGRTVLMRVKSSATDYRFLPEPNLPRLRLRDEWIEKERKAIDVNAPHMVYIFQHKFPVNFAFATVSEPKVYSFIEKCLTLMESTPKDTTELLHELRQVFKSENIAFPPSSEQTVKACARLIDLSLQRKVTHLAYLDLIRLYAGQPESDFVEVDKKITELDLWAINDESELLKIVDDVFAEAPPSVIENARNKPKIKHFNKLRNLVANKLGKRIHIEDAERLVALRLGKTR